MEEEPDYRSSELSPEENVELERCYWLFDLEVKED